MALLTRSYLFKKAEQSSPYLTESNIRSFSAKALASNTKAAGSIDGYDIFLSHAYEDAILIKGLHDELVERGFSVYVDWLEDAQLNRGHVTEYTAAVLRGRMQQSRCLLYATSQAAKSSVWMPWELGYMDGHTSCRVAIAPMVLDNEKDNEFNGQEYLGLYPYLDKTGDRFYIHESAHVWVGFASWLDGQNPQKRL